MIRGLIILSNIPVFDMKQILTQLILLLFPCFVWAQLSVNEGNFAQYTDNIGGTGIHAVYLFKDLSNTSLSYTSDAAIVRFYKYTKSLSDRELIPSSDIVTSASGNETSYIITHLEDSRGYYAEVNGGVTAAIWITDYSKHLPALNSIEVIESEDNCHFIGLYINKQDELVFYANNGGQVRIKRKYKIKYKDKKWNAEAKIFEDTDIETEATEIGTDYPLKAPLTDTQFILSGDQFAEQFDIKAEIWSKPYTAIATQAMMYAEQVSNESETGFTQDIGGSAPAEIHFYGYGNEPTAHYYTWLIYKDSNENDAIARYTDKDIKYTFNESGKYNVKLEVADRNSMCSDTTSVEFSISVSKLEIPNYFSPGDENGLKEFKVTYKSLVKFKCTIFNRWGNKLYEWTDPSQGWDGKHNGRYVNTGVYFYVIVAEGSEGKKWKEAGDINVLRKK